MIQNADPRNKDMENAKERLSNMEDGMRKSQCPTETIEGDNREDGEEAFSRVIESHDSSTFLS